MSYTLDYLPSAKKAIAGLPRDVQRRLFQRIDTLAQNPRPHGSIKLTDEDVYRVRVGDYRVLYAIDDGHLLVLVIDVGNRRDVYRRK